MAHEGSTNGTDAWNDWGEDWGKKPARSANRLEARKPAAPAPFVYTPPPQPACTAPLPSASATAAPAAQPATPRAPSASFMQPTAARAPPPAKVPTYDVRGAQRDIGDWSEPLHRTEQQLHTPPQQQRSQYAETPVTAHGGLASAFGGALGQGIAANMVGPGMGGALGGDAMQQVAAGMAMNYLGGSLTTAEAAAATYTGSKLAALRYYFQVDNTYVIQKLRVLAIPYRHPEWERATMNGDASGQMQPPKGDVNAPDLYIPLMAFITYILLVGFAAGASGSFTPELLGMTASSGIVILVLEVTAIKLAFYLLQGSRATFLDLLSCSGYKFLCFVLTMIFRLVLGSTAGYVVMTISSASIGTFMVKTLRQCFADSNGFTPGFMTEGIGSPGRKEKRKMQNYSLIGVGVLQLPLAWYACSV